VTDPLDVLARYRAGDVLALYRAGPPWRMAVPELPLRCPMCYRRLSDISMVHGEMTLLRVGMSGGPAPRRLPKSRPATAHGGSSLDRGKPRQSRAIVYELGDGRGPWRVFCRHKQADRGHLDRTLTASTLERLYAAALAAGRHEVVLS